jgi:hypothetical protein
MRDMTETTNIRIEGEVAEALKTNYLDNDEDFEFESMNDVLAFLIERDVILTELESDPEIQSRVADVERNMKIAELEEELARLKSEAAESHKKSGQASRAQPVVA